MTIKMEKPNDIENLPIWVQKMANCESFFEILPKWRKLGKSGHTLEKRVSTYTTIRVYERGRAFWRVSRVRRNFKKVFDACDTSVMRDRENTV